MDDRVRERHVPRRGRGRDESDPGPDGDRVRSVRPRCRAASAPLAQTTAVSYARGYTPRPMDAPWSDAEKALARRMAGGDIIGSSAPPSTNPAMSPIA